MIHAVGVQLLPDKYLLIVDISGGRDNFCIAVGNPPRSPFAGELLVLELLDHDVGSRTLGIMTS